MGVLKMKFKKEFLTDELDLPWKAIEDTIIDTRRWSIDHEIIFKYEDKYYQTTYSIGATEGQEEAPFEYDPDEIECLEVEQKEVVVKQWVVKK
jgi:hypothetical protein